MDDSGGAVNSVGGSGGAVGVRGGNPGMDQCDDATSSRISSREMHRVGCENLLERSEVIVGRGSTSWTQTISYLSSNDWRCEMAL